MGYRSRKIGKKASKQIVQKRGKRAGSQPVSQREMERLTHIKRLVDKYRKKLWDERSIRAMC